MVDSTIYFMSELYYEDKENTIFYTSKYLKIVYLNYTHRLVPIGHSKGQRVTFLLRLQF